MLTLEIGSPIHFDQGAEKGSLCIDRFIKVGSSIVISGWIYNSKIGSFGPDGVPDELASRRYFTRADVAEGFGYGIELVQGFLILSSTEDAKNFILEVLQEQNNLQAALSITKASSLLPDTASSLLEDFGCYAGLLHIYLSDSSAWLSALATFAPSLPSQGETKGHLEMARGINDVGGLVIGWSIAQNQKELLLLSESGVASSLDDAARWNRPDIVEVFSNTHGSLSHFAGFLSSLKGAIKVGEKICLLSIAGDQMIRISETTWEAAPKDPLSFARWAFDYPTPMTRFYERLSRHDGPILEALIRRHRCDLAGQRHETSKYGRGTPAPKCSIVIPIYKRFDFMRNQLLELSEDPFIRQDCELIYVLDDPLLEDALRGAASIFYDSYRLPFEIVYSSVNRGFAGATNLGVSLARAPLILLLNSDVIPIETGWLSEMVEQLESDRNVGIVGSRLLFANGAIQHDGMTFSWEPSWKCHLNKHPNAGFDPHALNIPSVTTEKAVTGACMLLRKEEYASVNGLDDEFLIGDFEDSDLCLKFASRELVIKCVHFNKLTHLERQSFSSLGSSGFRDKVARYNAWRHERRWGDAIRSSIQGGGETL